MRKHTYRTTVIGLWLLILLPAASLAAGGESIIAQGGKNPAALACATCHGLDGKGMPAAGFPRLSGLSAGYIRKQIDDFRSGARDNATMKPIASAMSNDEVAAVAEVFAALPKVSIKAGADRTATPAPGSGAWIALRGAWDRNIPECVLCHGPAGVGVGDTFPPLAGQSSNYMQAQLNAWRTQTTTTGKGKAKKTVRTPPTRNNDPNGLMGHIAVSLTDAEIKAVTEYFEGLGEAQ